MWRVLETPAPLVIVAVLYLFQAAAYWRTGRDGMAVAFVAYALANAGFVWAWYRGPTGG